MAIRIDHNRKPEFLGANEEFVQHINIVRKGDDYMPAEAFQGTSAGPTLLRDKQNNPMPDKQNDLVNSVSGLNQGDNKPVAGS